MEMTKSAVSVIGGRKLSETVAISAETALNKQAAGEIIAITAKVFTVAVSKTAAEVTARAVFNIIHKTEESENYESAVEFKVLFKDVEGALLLGACFDYCVNDLKLTSEGDVYKISAIIDTEAHIFENTRCEYISSLPTAITKKRSFSCMEKVCDSSGTYDGEDEKELPLAVRRVLVHSEQVSVSQAQCGINSVIVDGEIHCRLHLATFGGETMVENAVFAFRYELECADAMPDCTALANACITACSYKLYVDEENSKTTITAMTSVNVGAQVFAENKYECIEDAFSNSVELNTETGVLPVVTAFSSKRFKEKCFGEAVCENIEAYKVKGLLDATVYALNYSADSGKLNIEGILRADILLTDGENAQRSVRAELPFAFAFDVSGEVLDVKVLIKNAYAKQLDGKAVLECEALFDVVAAAVERVTAIVSVEEGEQKAVDDAAISIVFVSRGDDCWAVCKKSGLDEQSLMKQNPELVFPAPSDVNIVVYKKLDF